MRNPASDFLREANRAAGSSSPSQSPPDEVQVLGALNRADVGDITALANVLQTNAQTLTPVVDSLLGSGLISAEGNGLALSESGQRALRYSNLAKF